MRVKVKNNSPALQGVSTLEGTKWIKSGGTLTIDVEDTTSLERLPFLEVEYSADGVPVGDLPAPPKSLLGKAKALAPADDTEKVSEGTGEPMIPTIDEVLSAEVVDLPAVSMAMKKPELLKIAKKEGVEFETDDNKADLIRKINAARK